MEPDAVDKPGTDDDDDSEPSTESLLEALLVDDAEVVWDPATGRPKIVLAQKNILDRQPRSE